ncbi:hypothetical protein EUGRSUZ_L01670 [Eucalyptus grandis]|uniref:Calcineurin-like phosphoesterase domain-containing protein n=1 Tax=Eucalyptus grandis TaxID=71139 RepID=A0A058ZUP4_EUCGR|nr:hypothetical protein EUGRSUZ_L01670 [Eucalyptus grandis]
MEYICHKSWLGGWFMPQKKSYFALQLPKNWWVFGLDLALHHDVDADQFIFFSKLVEEKVGVKDSVIILTHEPNWLLDWYENNDSGKKVSGKNVSRLIRDYLKERCKLRIAGDLHHYMRHSSKLLMGREYCGATYETKASYPSFEYSSLIAFQNVSKFRKKNLQFDVIGGTIYFVLAFSMFPQCQLNQMLQDDSVSGLLRSFNVTVWAAFKYLLEQSYVSLAGALLLLTASILFVPSIRPWKQRVIIGVVHVSVHLTAALFLMIMMELAVETYIGPILSPTSGYDRSYEQTLGLYSACTEFIKSAFDCLEVMAVSRIDICRRGMESMSRGTAAIYYASVLHYFWVISNPVVSLVFGSYLYVCAKWLHLHYDEAFSSLRIADYKGFTRFHINKEGDLEIYTLVVDKVPEKWKRDKRWEEEEKQREKTERSHLRKFPSKWISADPSKGDPVETVRIVDYFVIQRNGESHQESPVTEPAQPEPEPEPEKQEEVMARPSTPEEIQEGEALASASKAQALEDPVFKEHVEPETQKEPGASPSVEPEETLRSEKEKEEETRKKKGEGKVIEEETERSNALPPERETEPIRQSDDERPCGEGKRDDHDEHIDAEFEQTSGLSQVPEKKAKAEGEPSEKKEAEKGESTNGQVMSAIQELKDEIIKVEKMIRSLSCFNLDNFYLDACKP